MDVNKQAIFSTRPWKTFGEGPASEGSELQEQGFNEGKGKPFTAEDIRYTISKDGKTLYAIVMSWPEDPISLKSLGTGAKLLDRPVQKIELLGSRATIRWKQDADALVIETTPSAPDSEARSAAVYMMTL